MVPAKFHFPERLDRISGQQAIISTLSSAQRNVLIFPLERVRRGTASAPL